MKSLNRYTTIIMLAGVILFGGCSDDIIGTNVDNNEYTAEADFDYTVDLTNQTMLSLEAVNSPIIITGTADEDQIRITGRRIVGSESQEDADYYLDSLQVDINAGSDVVYVKTEQPEHAFGRLYRVDYEITVPFEMKLAISNVNGSIAISYIEDDVMVNGVNGQVAIHEIEGDLSVSVVNGQVVGDMVLPDGGNAEIEIVNGLIDLSIPTNTSAEFSASLVNGNIYISDLTMTDQEISSTSISGVLGAGNGEIRLSTVNGNIYVDGE